MSGELRLVKRAPSQTSCILLRFFFRSGISSVQRLHIFTQFRTTSIHYVYMCSDVFFVLCYFILGASYLVETPFRPVGIWALVCILVGMPTAQSVTDKPTSCSVHVPGHALSRC